MKKFKAKGKIKDLYSWEVEAFGEWFNFRLGAQIICFYTPEQKAGILRMAKAIKKGLKKSKVKAES